MGVSIRESVPIALSLTAALLAGCAESRAGGESSLDSAAALRDDVRRLISHARDEVYPALVNISVVTAQYWNGKEVKGRSTGSGTIIDTDGHVVTNQHVTDGGIQFTCTLADKREVTATLIGEDALTDIAVLRLDLTEVGDERLPIARFGDSEELQVGDYVMAMGSPYSLSRSVTLGIVSNTERVFASDASGEDIEDMELESGQRTGLFTRWIQHDALIHPGNSGGPLVNLRGEIVGVNELGGNAMGFAIPSNLASETAQSLIQHGRVPRAWTGISVRSVSQTGRDRGALVSAVVDESPAAEAGIVPGDVLLAVDGRPTDVLFTEEAPLLLKQLASLPVGKEIPLRIERSDGRRETLVLIPRTMREDLGDERALRGWGVTIRGITPKMARDRRLPSTDGVVITSVRSGSPAGLGEPPLDFGDVLTRIDGVVVRDLEDAVAEYGRIIISDPMPERVLLSFDRAGKDHLTLIKPKPDAPDDPPTDLPRAWIGIASQPVMGRLAERMGIGEARGYRITGVYPSTTAADAGLRVGDVVLELNGREVAPRSMQDFGTLSRAIRQLNVGVDARLGIWRDGVEKEVNVRTEASPMLPSQALRERDVDFDLVVRDLTFFDRDAARWDESIRGALVEQVEPGGWAEAAGIRPGDLIQRIEDVAVSGVRDYRAAMNTVSDQRPDRVLFVVLRGAKTRILIAEPDWTPEDVASDDS